MKSGEDWIKQNNPPKSSWNQVWLYFSTSKTALLKCYSKQRVFGSLPSKKDIKHTKSLMSILENWLRLYDVYIYLFVRINM